jgi:hypothetical protein
MSIKNFKQPSFADVDRLLSEEAEQGKGIITFQIIGVTGIDVPALERMGKLNRKAQATRLTFRLAFYSPSFDLETCPSFVSEELESEVDEKRKVLNYEMVWTEESLP